MVVNITRKYHLPHRYLAEWSINGNGYTCWFDTQQELKDYFRSWDATLNPTNFILRGASL